MEFAEQSNFHQLFSNVYFTEYKLIRRFSDSTGEIFQQDIFTFEDYEHRFNEILNQGYSWVNLSFAGILEDILLVVIELPNCKNNVPFEAASVNLSLSTRKIIENNWDAAPFYKIID